MAETECTAGSLVALGVSSAWAVLTMDSTWAKQDRLLEDSANSGTSACPKALLQTLGLLEPPDQRDRAQCTSIKAGKASEEGRNLGGPDQGTLCQNGPVPQLPDPLLPLAPTTSSVGPDASPGVAGYHDNLRKSQGASAEGSVRKEAL